LQFKIFRAAKEDLDCFPYVGVQIEGVLLVSGRFVQVGEGTRVCNTAPVESLTCTVSVSNARVVLVSAVSICSQKLSVADVAVDGMLTCWSNVSVVVVPWPSSQALNVPE